jgi:uncharacterized membrane protein
MKLSYLVRGTPGHPVHPPLTDATIGTYTFATAAAVLAKLGVAEEAFAHGWWLALVVGLAINVPTSSSGFADWLVIQRGTPLKRTATVHAIAMVLAAGLFLVAAVVGYDAYRDDTVSTGGLVLTLLGFGTLTFGGFAGGSVVFVHGMRVLNLVHEPAKRSLSPLAEPEKKQAEGGSGR